LLGRNTKPMGGFAGLAEAMGLANELQGDCNFRGHGFMALANAYQYGSLQDIVDLIESSVSELQPAAVIASVTDFITQLSREGHFDHEKHEDSMDSLEAQFKSNNEGPKEHIFLSVRPKFFYEKRGLPSLWDKTPQSELDVVSRVAAEAAHFKEEYEADVQFIFSRVQHHWHPRNQKGERQAPRYCCVKSKKAMQCKRGFPKKVLCDKFNKVRQVQQSASRQIPRAHCLQGCGV